MILCLTATEFHPFKFSVLGFALAYGWNIYIIMTEYDFCLLPAYFCYVIAYVRKFEGRM